MKKSAQNEKSAKKWESAQNENRPIGEYLFWKVAVDSRWELSLDHVIPVEYFSRCKLDRPT